jgi:hypothetical protein
MMEQTELAASATVFSVHDIDAALAYFRDVLDFRVAFR